MNAQIFLYYKLDFLFICFLLLFFEILHPKNKKNVEILKNQRKRIAIS